MNVRSGSRTTIVALLASVLALLAAASLATTAAGKTVLPGTNGKIYYRAAIPDTESFGYWSMNLDGTGDQLAFEMAMDDPVISPDGRKVAFTMHVDDTWKEEVFVINIDGTGLTRVTNRVESERFPVFSPDGKRIVFTSWTVGDESEIEESGLYASDLDGGNLQHLTADHTEQIWQHVLPAFSPDGTKIAYSADVRHASGHNALYVMDADGGNPQTLVPVDAGGPNHSYHYPALSPDGSKIVFVRDLEEIFIANADGSGMQQLTYSAIQGHSRYPSFSPDGRQIVFESRRSLLWEIYRMNLDGSGETLLAGDNGVLGRTEPGWAPGPPPLIQPTLSVKAKKNVRVGRKSGGRKLKVACRLRGGSSQVRLRSCKAVVRGGGRLGSRNVNASGRRQVNVAVKLKPKAYRKAAAKRKGVRAKVQVTAKTSAGRTLKRTIRVRLRAPRA